MGEQGEYVVYVGTPTTPLHNRWADAAIAYQRARYPKMTLAAERFPGADDTEAIHRITRDVIAAYPAVRGILGMSANGPIGAGWAVRERGLQRTIAVVGTVLPSQAAALIKDGAIRCGYLWSPADAGYAITALAKLALDGVEMEDGMEIPGLGKARVDPGNRRISVDRMIAVDRDNVAELAAQGL
jgi:simple sugar transport system substrate-binding protein